MAKATLGVGLIARNAGKTIRDCVKSFADYTDQIVVVLAGESTDNTAKEARKGSKKVELFSFDWVDDFSAARNFCFSKLHTDFLLWVDADDVVYQPENLPKLIDGMSLDVGAIWFPYHYAVDEFGNPVTLYERERLLRASCGWVWKGRLHETVQPLKPCKFARSEDVIIRHNQHAGGSRNDRNFRLLNIMYKENPEEKRVWLYLGHQNFAAQNWTEAAKWYLKFGTDNGAIILERYQALCYACKTLREARDQQCIDVAMMAIELCPSFKDAYLELAHGCLLFNDFDKAIHWATLADTKEIIHEPPHVIFINPLDYGFNRYCLLGEAYLKKGNFDMAMQFLQEAYKTRPLESLKTNMDYVADLQVRNKISDGIKMLAVHLLENRELVKLPHVVEATPFWFRDTPDFQMLKQGTQAYIDKMKSEPLMIESPDKKQIIVDIGSVQDPKSLLAELDQKYERIKITCAMPHKDTRQFNVYSLWDMQQLITSKEGRHILNLQREQNQVFAEYELKQPDNLLVRFYLGQGLEQWNPMTIRTIGCGGSETAAFNIAKGMASQSCQPLIYAMDNQVWDGVVFIPYDKFSPENSGCHLFISSRVPQIYYQPIAAKQKWLWFHDVHRWNLLTPEVVSQLSAIIVLSKWHANFTKATYPFLKEAEIIDMDNNPLTYDDCVVQEKWYSDVSLNKVPPIVIIGNGLDTDRFQNMAEQRIKHRFIWCSSPDRGLEQVLDLWHLIKERWQDAELKIFYGWDYFDNYLHIPTMREFKTRLLSKLKQPGVQWMGRVGQEQIAKELMKADIMLYPPPHDFRETYGIAFLEAQAAGVVCVYRQNGALGETIGDRGIPLALNSTQEEIAQKIMGIDTNPECDKIRVRGREYAMSRTWQAQANKFLSLYRRLSND